MYLGATAGDFTPYELIDVTAGKYAATTAEGFATVEIFRFPDFVKAFGAYSIRKDAARTFLATANEGYVSKYAVHIWRGPFYVRVTGGGAADPFKSLTHLATSVAERMPAAPAMPAVFAFFPTESRIPNSERYSAEKGFGIPVLGNSFQAHYQGGEEVIEGLIIPAANKAAATKILDAYRDLYLRNGKLLDPITNLGEDNFTGEDRFMGRTVAFRLDRFVIAFNGFRDRQRLIELAIATDARILNSIRRQLIGQDERARQASRPQPAQNQPPWAQPQQ
jgi:hypothetical protein